MGTHKILVNGTAFAVTGGTELINGTICKTGGGRTLVNGTAFEVKFSSQQTWVINKDPKIPNSNIVPASFTSNGKKYLRFAWTGSAYRSLKYYYNSDGAGNDNVYDEGWWPLGEAYRTVTFEEPPTGELLKLLQTIAVQQ